MTITLLILGGIALVTILIHNRIISLMNSVIRAWSDVTAQELQKNRTLPKIEEMVEKYQIHEADILEATAKLRSALREISSESVDVSQLKKVQSRTGSLINNLHAVSENYPDLKASTLFADFMAEVSQQERDVAAAIRIFNQNVEEFNTTIEIFPHSIVNRLISKKKTVERFSDEEAERGFSYKPNF